MFSGYRLQEHARDVSSKLVTVDVDSKVPSMATIPYGSTLFKMHYWFHLIEFCVADVYGKMTSSRPVFTETDKVPAVFVRKEVMRVFEVHLLSLYYPLRAHAHLLAGEAHCHELAHGRKDNRLRKEERRNGSYRITGTETSVPVCAVVFVVF